MIRRLAIAGTIITAASIALIYGTGSLLGYAFASCHADPASQPCAVVTSTGLLDFGLPVAWGRAWAALAGAVIGPLILLGCGIAWVWKRIKQRR